MSIVRTVVHPGWLSVSGPQVDAVVAAGDRQVEALEAAAADGLFALLEALAAEGLSSVPDLAACAPVPTGLRVVLRGDAVVVLPDGTRLVAQGRMPWLDVDLDLAPAEVGQVVLEAPAPMPSRGWRPPARLTRAASSGRDQPADSGTPDADPVAVPAVNDAPADAPVDAPAAESAPGSARTELLPVSEAGPGTESAVSAEEPTERVPAPTLQAPPAEESDGPVVLAVRCPAGHPSPPEAGRCPRCGRDIPPQQPVAVPRPSLGVLRISTGGSVPLDRGVLLGRAPHVEEELPADQRPRVLRVGGPDRDISRNHAEIALEGWRVLVRDLGSTNGTTVALPGQDPVRLRPAQDHAIEPGTVIRLADEVVLTYEVDG